MQVESYALPASERRLTLLYLGIGIAHLAVGVTLGLMQVLQHVGIDLYGPNSIVRHYYQGLAMHGVLNALVFTTFFIVGFLGFVTSYSLQRPMHRGLSLATFWVMVAGLLLTDYALFSGRASVLYTSYAPLKASPPYYIGLALVVVGTLLLLLNITVAYLGWRRDHPGRRAPLLAFGAMATMAMWGLATVGIVTLFLFILIPWSFGWTTGVDPLMARTLFWMTGHPLVYFWLLPAYLSWYFMLPKQAGGKLFSEPLARLSLLLFIPLSLPVGLHHQYLDPGVSVGMKAVHGVLTFAVFMPSMITAFTVLASLEIGGRVRGGKGLLGWIRTLPWQDPAVAAQLLAMVLFALGGISGLINAAYTMNLVVHNTLFIPGHFHLTVGSAVTLTFMAISYWLVPYLTGRRLWSARMGVWQAWTWFAGMTLMSRGLSWAGVLGAPRRTALGAAPYFLDSWTWPTQFSAVGGTLLTISSVLFFLNIGYTIWRSPAQSGVAVPLAEPVADESRMPIYLDRLTPWVVGGVVLVILAYGPTLVNLLANLEATQRGFSPF